MSSAHSHPPEPTSSLFRERDYTGRLSDCVAERHLVASGKLSPQVSEIQGNSARSCAWMEGAQRGARIQAVSRSHAVTRGGITSAGCETSSGSQDAGSDDLHRRSDGPHRGRTAASTSDLLPALAFFAFIPAGLIAYAWLWVPPLWREVVLGIACDAAPLLAVMGLVFGVAEWASARAEREDAALRRRINSIRGNA